MNLKFGFTLKIAEHLFLSQFFIIPLHPVREFDNWNYYIYECNELEIL